jgi:hypothetical protein
MAGDVSREGVVDIQRRMRATAAAGNKTEAVRVGRAAVGKLLSIAESLKNDKAQRDIVISHVEILLAEVAQIQKNEVQIGTLTSLGKPQHGSG